MPITVARKARQFPRLQEAIASGELSVSKASRIASVVDNQPSVASLFSLISHAAG